MNTPHTPWKQLRIRTSADVADRLLTLSPRTRSRAVSLTIATALQVSPPISWEVILLRVLATVFSVEDRRFIVPSLHFDRSTQTGPATTR